MRRPLLVLLLSLLLALRSFAQVPQLHAFGAVGAAPSPPWRVVGLPKQSKPFTTFSVVELDGRPALRIEADKSYGNLVEPMNWLAASAYLGWRWRVEQLLEAGDLRSKAGDDTAIKVCVLFDLPLDALPVSDRLVLRYARSQTSDFLPGATVCYVWDAHLPVGTTLDSPFTRRLRYMVLQSGSAKLGQFVAQRRDVVADFLLLFGDESKTVPAIVGIAVGADADNTQGHSVAYVRELSLEP
ncbi:MAG: DUF3047 domain-containing protein [Variovorax sp.]